MCFGGSSAGSDARQQQLSQQKQVLAATGQINKAFAGYTPEWYNNYTQQYTNSAMPSLMGQYEDTQKQLGYKLGDQGLIKSGTAGQANQALQTQLGQQQQGVANQALNATNSLRQQIAQQQQGLIGQANVAADPLSTAQQATGAAASFAAPSLAQPIAGAFQNFANMWLGNKAQQAYGGYGRSSLSNPYWGSTLGIGSGLPVTQGGQ